MIKMIKPGLQTAPRQLASPVKLVDPVYQSVQWQALLASIKAVRGNRCEVPGCTSGHATIIGDHIVELKDGGAPFDRRNVQLMCLPCHNRKTAKAARVRREGGV